MVGRIGTARTFFTITNPSIGGPAGQGIERGCMNGTNIVPQYELPNKC